MSYVSPPRRDRVALPGILVLSLLVAFLAGSSPAAAGVDRWTLTGPPGGRVERLVADPSAPGHLYAAHQEGLFKTLDGGRHWLPLRNGLPAGAVAHVALDPSHPATVYAAVRSPTAPEPWDGLYRSLDAGATWERRGDLPAWEAFAVGTGDRAALFAAGSLDPVLRTTTVFRSVDAGATWQPILDLPVGPLDLRALVAHPVSAGTVYVVLGDALLRSTDAGDTWAEIGPELQGEPPGYLLSLAVAPSAPDVLYAFGSATFRSEDGGASWQALGTPPCGYRPVVDPGAAETLYLVCSDHLARSRDGGETWEPIFVDPAGSLPGLRDLAIDPVSPETLYVGTVSLGVYKTRSGGARWHRASEELRGLGTSSIAFDPRAPRSLYAVTVGGYDASGLERRWLWRSFDGGAIWRRWLPGLAAPVNQIVPDIHRPGRIYLVTGQGLFAWEEGGVGLRRIWSRAVSRLALDPGDPARFYAVSGSAVFRSLDGGVSWSESLSFREHSRVYGLVSDPASPGRVYALVEDWVVGGESGYRLYRSEDGGWSWSETFSWVGVELHLAESSTPGAPSILFTASYYTYRSIDGGDTWVQTDFPGEVVLALPSEPPTLYVQGDEGFFRSQDGGGTWKRLQDSGNRSVGWNEVVVAHPGAPERLFRYHLFGESAQWTIQAVGSRPLRLQGGRFEARAAWRDAEGRFGAARPLRVSRQAGAFTLPGRKKILAALDVLDERVVDGRFRVLGASLLPLEATVTVTDRATGLSRDFYFPPDRAVSHLDSESFPPLPEPPDWEPAGEGAEIPGALAAPQVGRNAAPVGRCEPSPTTLCFLAGRFRVRVVQLGAADGARVAPMAWPSPVAPLAWEAGSAWFDDPGVMSVVVQMVAGREIDGSVWVLVGGLSERSYAVRVLDTLTGARRTYSHAEGPPTSVADLEAF
jgi:photosystem II stability/assembly factor-like uncharacterized protein